MFQVGSIIRHIKRGSSYRIVAKLDHFGERRIDFGDKDKIMLTLKHKDREDRVMDVEVNIQISDPANINGPWFIYATTLAKDCMFFARPVAEFTPDRFEEML